MAMKKVLITRRSPRRWQASVSVDRKVTLIDIVSHGSGRWGITLTSRGTNDSYEVSDAKREDAIRSAYERLGIAGNVEEEMQSDG